VIAERSLPAGWSMQHVADFASVWVSPRTGLSSLCWLSAQCS